MATSYFFGGRGDGGGARHFQGPRFSTKRRQFLNTLYSNIWYHSSWKTAEGKKNIECPMGATDNIVYAYVLLMDTSDHFFLSPFRVTNTGDTIVPPSVMGHIPLAIGEYLLTLTLHLYGVEMDASISLKVCELLDRYL